METEIKIINIVEAAKITVFTLLAIVVSYIA